MMKILSKSALAFAALLAFIGAAQASENVVIGAACTDAGVSVMTTNQQDIATCLKNSGGALVWKSMANSSGSPCGGTPSGTVWQGEASEASGCGVPVYAPLYQCRNGSVAYIGQLYAGYTTWNGCSSN